MRHIASIDHACAEICGHKGVVAIPRQWDLLKEAHAPPRRARIPPRLAKAHSNNVYQELVNIKIALKYFYKAGKPDKGPLVSLKIRVFLWVFLPEPRGHSDREHRHALFYSATEEKSDGCFPNL